MKNLYVPKQGVDGQVTIVTGPKGRTKRRLITLNLLSDTKILDLLSDGHLIGLFVGRDDAATEKLEKTVEAMRARKGKQVGKRMNKKFKKLNVTIPAFKFASAPVATPAVNPVFALVERFNDLSFTTATKVLKGVDSFADSTLTDIRAAATAVGVPNANKMQKEEALEKLFAIVKA